MRVDPYSNNAPLMSAPNKKLQGLVFAKCDRFTSFFTSRIPFTILFENASTDPEAFAEMALAISSILSPVAEFRFDSAFLKLFSAAARSEEPVRINISMLS